MSEEHSANETAETGSNHIVNRRSFVKALGGVGGAAITGSALSTSAQAAATSHPSSKNKTSITDDKLIQLISKISKQEDVMNVMDATMRETVQSGKLVELSDSSRSGGIVMTQNSPQVAKENGLNNLPQDDVVVAAVQHKLENGTEMTVVAFVTKDRVLEFRRYSEVTDGVTSVARVWGVNGETQDEMTLVLKESSYNGRVPKPPSAFARNRCPGCAPAPGDYSGGIEDHDCRSVDVQCVVTRCALCGICWGPVSCLTCLVTWCPLMIPSCCTYWAPTCRPC